VAIAGSATGAVVGEVQTVAVDGQGALRFTEIEHKYVPEAFRRAVTALGPTRHSALRVRDRYFLTDAGMRQGFILRHRHDRELHELTLKTFGADAQVRGEINVALTPVDQDGIVDAFVDAQGVVWRGELWKVLDVWYFADCEVVYYVAEAEGRQVRCVEFEAVGAATVEDALQTMARYERATGFDGARRTPASLVELMWPGALAGRRLGA
jgi:hypothetical protein